MRGVSQVTTGAALLLASGCAAQPGDTGGQVDADVVVIADDIFFEPDRIEVPAGETVILHVANDGGIVHDLVLDDGWETGEVRPGQSVTLEFGPLSAPTTAWCSIPGHRDAGMDLEVTIADG